ncbi:hypothetical protein [Desulfolucanica intricata]|uniref:hypothetical protein n=1 Tax=Desulfolucanica intricata TaxID=1285191 RepID=UPI00082DC41A|nr:hypothetical protein [Desulfolucanica intricata]
MVIIDAQSLLNELNDTVKIQKLQEIISYLPLVFIGETLFKGCFCLSQKLVDNLLNLVIQAKDSIQKINVQIKKNLLVVQIVLKRKNNLYYCLLKIKNIEINIKESLLVFHFHEMPQFKTNNVLENLFVNFGSMVTNLKSGEEFIIKYLIGNKQGIVFKEKSMTVDIKKIPYACEIYNKDIFGLKFTDVVEIRDVQIKEGLVEVYWDITIPSAKKLIFE